MWFKIDDFKRDIKKKFQQSFPYKLLLCTFIYHEYNNRYTVVDKYKNLW